jgi:hypothetical protein
MFQERELTNRKCAGCLVICLALMGGILFWSFEYGNPKRLTHGTDWQGLICGYDEAVLDKKFLYFCGSPERSGSFPKYILQGSTACIASCPTDNLQDVECLMPAFHNFSLQKNGTLGQLQNVETLNLVVTQSVMKQKSYAAEEFGGRFCVPDSKLNPALHEVVVNGPFGRNIRPLLAFGGLVDAVFLLALSALLALIMSVVYFYMLKKCAGPVIFASMILAFLLLLAFGLVCLWVVFLDPVNPPKDYAKINPIFSVYEGTEAKTYSVILGMVLVMAAGIIGLLAASSMTHIDEMIGLIDAALECLEDNPCFAWTYPLCQAATIIAIFYFFILSIPYVASLATLDNARIKMDGKAIIGLQKHWEKSYLDNYALTFYVLCCWWILEMYIQYTNFVIAYVVARYYFVPVNAEKAANKGLKNLAEAGNGKHVKVRVGGLDPVYGERQGVVTHGARGEKMLVVPMGKKAPGLGRYANVGEQEVFKKDKGQIADFSWVVGGNLAALGKHIGSIAVGAPIIAFLRPFRLFSQCLSGFLNRNSPDPMKGPGFDPHPGTANLKGCFALFSACLDQVVGAYSKNAFVEMVLSGGRSGEGSALGEFGDACDSSFRFLVTCGGSVAYLHGAMLMYEAIGCLSITCFCGWTVLVVQDKVDWFNDKASGWYIEDKNASAFAACVVAFVVSYSWMSLWNQAADVLLYCVAWNRRQVNFGHEFEMSHGDMIEEPGKCCPNALRYLIPAYELNEHYEHGVHAHGVGQLGTIIAAMEHGAMNKPGAPNYSTAMGSVFATGTKALGT